MTAEGPPAQRPRPSGPLRVAAVGDLHVGAGEEADLREDFSGVADRADVLLLAGDLTRHGRLEEARVVAKVLSPLPLPIVCVLGNHEYDAGQQHLIRGELERSGVAVLEGERTVLELAGRTVGIGGTKGFGGGFVGACGSDFGEPEMKVFARHSELLAARFADALASLECDVRIALTHYSPTADTLEGEPREIYPFLGSYHLASAIDGARCHLGLHGHAHRGIERGRTTGGVPVYNVARPVIGAAYRVYQLPEG